MSSKIPKKPMKRAVAEDTPEMRSMALLSSGPVGPIGLRTSSSEPMAKTAPRSSATKSSAKVWNVVAAPELPPYYFLERTHVRVPDLSLKEVAERIVDCLRELSIAASYDAEKAVVNAETVCSMQFAVRLWKDQGAVVVEVQRGAGCCFVFHHVSKAILRAAKGLSQTEMPVRRSFSLPSCIPPKSPEERKQDLREGLEIAASLIDQDEVDSQLMGIQSLNHLTKVAEDEAFAAEYILEHDRIINTLLSLIGDSHAPEEHAVMRREAFAVLARCLVSLKNHGTLPVALRRLSTQTLTSALVDQVSAARQQPHEACQALSCLQTMTEVSTVVRERTMQLGIDSVVSAAEAEGHVKHRELEECCARFSQSFNAKQA